MACQPSPDPPPDHQSTVVNGGSQRWPTTVNGVGPPSEHRRTTGQRWWLTGSWAGSGRVLGQVMGQVESGHPCVMPRGTTCQLTWQLTWRGGDYNPPA
ncbi:hypothetical protein Tco_0402294 [Tanacetum coccineum]